MKHSEVSAKAFESYDIIVMMHSVEFMLSMIENILQPFKNHLGTNESSVLKKMTVIQCKI